MKKESVICGSWEAASLSYVADHRNCFKFFHMAKPPSCSFLLRARQRSMFELWLWTPSSQNSGASCSWYPSAGEETWHFLKGSPFWFLRLFLNAFLLLILFYLSPVTAKTIELKNIFEGTVFSMGLSSTPCWGPPVQSGGFETAGFWRFGKSPKRYWRAPFPHWRVVSRVWQGA